MHWLVVRALEIIQAENRRKKEEAEEANETLVEEPVVEEMSSEESVEDREVKVDSNNISTSNVSAETFSEGMAEETYLADKASALVQMAESYLSPGQSRESGNSLGEKYQVFLHINANAASMDCKVNQADHCSIDHKRFLAPRVARRLACDASLTTVLEDDEGNVLNIGRRSRVVPRAMAHALRIRDGGCRYPGCCQSQNTDAHHIKHWAEEGETSLENLVTLCRFHHGQLHSGEYHLHRDDSGDLVFTNSRSEVITRSFYPQFLTSHAGDCLDPDIDENTARSKWGGEKMDIDHALFCMFQQESKKHQNGSVIGSMVD